MGAEFFGGGDSFFDEQRFQTVQPPLVIRRRQIRCWWHLFNRAAELVNIPMSCSNQREPCCEQPRLPFGMEHRLIYLALDRAEAMHSAEIVNPVHQLTLISLASRVRSRL